VHVSAAAFGALVTIAGEIDIATVPRLRAALAAAELTGSDAVVADLSDVSFLDSTGLSVFLTLDRDLRERGARLAIACPEGPARLLFDVAGVGEILSLYPSPEAAVAGVTGPPT
jgi:anti-anti-sigma factor